MKSFIEFVNENDEAKYQKQLELENKLKKNKVYPDFDLKKGMGMPQVVSKIKNANERMVGVACPKAWKMRDELHLLKLDSFDKGLVKGIPLKTGEHIFRYQTGQTQAGKLEPLVKINVVKGLIYFLTQESSDSGEEIVFETSGMKVQYIRIKPEYIPNYV